MAKPKQSAASRPKAPAPAPGQPAGQPPPGKTGPGKATARKAGPARPGAAPGGRGPGARAAAPRPLVSVTEPGPLPRSVRIAVWLMYAGAALAALYLIATLATIGSARGELHRANPHWTAAQLTTGVHSLILSNVVIWVLTIAVWLIMARVNQAGRAWARNVATVLAALSTLTFILYLHEPGGLVGKLLLIPMWLVGLAAAALLWRRESTAFIRAGSG